MGWGRKRKQTPWEWGCGACRLWNRMRNLQNQQRKFCFWNSEFKCFSHSTFLWLEGVIEIYVIPLAFTFVLNYQILNRNYYQSDIVSFSKMWFNFAKSRVRRQSWIIGSVSMQALHPLLQNHGWVFDILLEKRVPQSSVFVFSWGISSSFLLPIRSLWFHVKKSLIQWESMGLEFESLLFFLLGNILTITYPLWASVVSL